MRELYLRPKDQPDLPIEAEVISPDFMVSKNINEIEKLEVYVGNKTHRLADFFDIEGNTAKDPNDQSIIIPENVTKTKFIGAKMSGGKITLEGDVGMHLGTAMLGGEIHVKGSTSDWAGAEMEGGLIQIEGNAGNQLGCAYRGSSEGMTGGCIHVKGSAGIETGGFMRRGRIIIEGDVGPFLGVHFNGGEIFVFGEASRRLGAGGKGNGGFIACYGGVESLLPTYLYDTTYRPVAMRLYMLQLRDELEIEKADEFLGARYRRYRGDLAVGGDAEILIFEE